jgi:hypothetical protein
VRSVFFSLGEKEPRGRDGGGYKGGGSGALKSICKICTFFKPQRYHENQNFDSDRLFSSLNPGQSFFSFRALTFLSRWDIFELTCNGNFDDARRSNASANARETRRRKRNARITSNDAFFVAHGVRCAPRGVAQIKWDILRHVVGDPTVAFFTLQWHHTFRRL